MRITSIAPVEIDGEISVTLTLVGRTLQNVLEMVSALKGSSFFATVFPLDDVDLADNLDAGAEQRHRGHATASLCGFRAQDAGARAKI